MRYAKLINDALTLAPSVLTLEGETVYNPTAEQYAADGWKPVTEGDPLPDKEFYTQKLTYTDTGDAITAAYEYVKEARPAKYALVQDAMEAAGFNAFSLLDALLNPTAFVSALTQMRAAIKSAREAAESTLDRYDKA